MDKLTSRKLWIALGGIIFVAYQVFLGGISPADGVDAVAKIALGYLAAEGAVDATSALRG